MPEHRHNAWSLPARILWIAVPLLLVAGAAAFFLWPREEVFYSDGERTWSARPDLGLRSVLWDEGARLEGLGDPRQDYDPCLSADGQDLYFTRGKAGGEADLYVAYRTVDGWTDPKPLAALNTGADEIGPALAPDGAHLYFYSDRAGGEGGYDLYVARHTADGWQPPENLGPAVNTPFNEYDPAVGPDGSRLLFASNRPAAEAEKPDETDWPATLREGHYRNDYDIYALNLADRSAPPRRLAPVCSGADDGQPTLSRDGRWLYFASNRPGGQGGYDIWRSRVADPPLAALMPPENLGRPVNTAAHELDPAVSLEGFGLYFSSDREATDTWAIYFARSHEVFRVVRTRRLAIGHIFGRLSWPLIGLIAALIGLVLTLLAMARLRRRPGLLASAMMVSLILHLVALSLFTLWEISTRVSELAEDEARFEVAVSLPDLAESELSSRLRASLEDLARTDTAKLAAEKSREMTAPEPPAPESPEVALARAEPEAAPKPLDIDRPQARPVDLSEPLRERPEPVPAPEPLPPEPVLEIEPKPVREETPPEPRAPRPVEVARREPARPTPLRPPRPEPAPERPAPAPEPSALARVAPPEPPEPETLPAPDITRPEPETVPAEKVVDLAPTETEPAARPVRVEPAPADRPASTRPLAAARAETTVPEPAAPARLPEAAAPSARPVRAADLADVTPPAEAPEASPVVPSEALARGPAVQPPEIAPPEALPPAVGPPQVARRGPPAEAEADAEPSPRSTVRIERAAGPLAATVAPRVAAPSVTPDLRVGPEAAGAEPLAREAAEAVAAGPVPALEAPAVRPPQPAPPAAAEVVDLAPTTAEAALRPVQGPEQPTDRPASTRPLAAARAEASVPEAGAPIRAPEAAAPAVRPAPPTAAIGEVALPAKAAERGPVVPEEALARGPSVPPAEVDPTETLPPAIGPTDVARRGPNGEGEVEPEPGPRTAVTVRRAAGPVAAEAATRAAAPAAADRLRVGPDAVAPEPIASDTVATAAAAPAPAIDAAPAGPAAMPAQGPEVVDLSAPEVPPPPQVVQGPQPSVTAAPREALAPARPETEAPDRPAAGSVPEAPAGGSPASPAAATHLASAVPAGEAVATPAIGQALGEAALPPEAARMQEVAPPPAPLPPKEVYRLRTEPDRAARIEKLGGTPETEAAVRRALVWFRLHQSPDGRWDVDGFMKHHKVKGRRADGRGNRREQDVGVTALAALAFVGAGHTHVAARGADGPTEHAETVRKAVDWLLEGQTEDGDLRRKGQMYDHCLAAMLLCESYSMTGDERLVEPIRKAVQFTLDAQNPGRGWRYSPRSDNDTSVLGWALMALKSAEIAGFNVPPKAYRGAANWLDRVRRGKHKGLYEYQPGRKPSPAMTAEGLFSEMLIDYDPAGPRTAESIAYLLDHEPRYVPQDKERTNFYYWYYATMALHQLGGAEWETWNAKVREALVTSQRDDGPYAGSWDPRTRWGDYGGRVYTTAMAALTLEVYYRYLPFYDLRLDGAK
ncbi:MAG: hypothetical protein R6X20_11865 [Phycisphaerae bacterium]